jgi:homospermidine synthase
LSARCSAGDILLDLAWNIDAPTILQWCRDHGVRYLSGAPTMARLQCSNTVQTRAWLATW